MNWLAYHLPLAKRTHLVYKLNIKKYIETKMAMRTHKFRLYPNKEAEMKMLNALELCRQTYNELLGLLNEQKEIDKAQIQGIIPT